MPEMVCCGACVNEYGMGMVVLFDLIKRHTNIYLPEVSHKQKLYIIIPLWAPMIAAIALIWGPDIWTILSLLLHG